jgi:hypothetical protein
VCAFDLIAHAHAARTENAPVGIEAKEFVRGVDSAIWKQVGEGNVIDPQAEGQILKFTMPVGDAHRTDVIALGEEHLKDHPTVFAQPFAVGLDDHSL